VKEQTIEINTTLRLEELLDRPGLRACMCRPACNCTQDEIMTLKPHNRVLHSYNPGVVYHAGAWYALLRLSNHDSCDSRNRRLPRPYVNVFSIKRWGDGHVREEVMWGLPHVHDCRLVPASDHLRIVCDHTAVFSLSASKEGFAVQQLKHSMPPFAHHDKNVNAFEVRRGVWLWANWPISPPGGQRTVFIQYDSGMASSAIPSRVLTKSSAPWEPRGSACCAVIGIQSEQRLVGIGHYQVTKMKNDYLSFAYAMDINTYDIVAISSPFCFALQHLELVSFDSPPVPECPAITLVYSISDINRTHVVLGVGVNDCHSHLMHVPRSSIASWFA